MRPISALYRAKNAGRNTIECAGQEIAGDEILEPHDWKSPDGTVLSEASTAQVDQLNLLDRLAEKPRAQIAEFANGVGRIEAARCAVCHPDGSDSSGRQSAAATCAAVASAESITRIDAGSARSMFARSRG